VKFSIQTQALKSALHSPLALLGPRSPPSSSSSSSSNQLLFRSGSYVLTEFSLPSSPVFVNLGWLEKSQITTGEHELIKKLQESSLNQTIELIGITRKSEKSSSFMSSSPLSSLWGNKQIKTSLALDLDNIIGIDSNAPFVEVTSPSPLSAIGFHNRSTSDFLEFPTSPFKHLVYSCTWFSLSAFSIYIAHRRFKTKKW
jgi:cytochrome oxidase assembly protein ShyY1